MFLKTLCHQRVLIWCSNIAKTEFLKSADSLYKSVTYLDGNTSMVLFQIFEANLQMKFSSTSNDMLAALFNGTLVRRNYDCV